MKNLIVLICLLFSFSSFSHDKDKGKHKGHNKHHHEPSAFEVIPLNSPVKGATAKFSLKLPTGFVVDKVKVKLVNAFDLKKDQKKFEDVNVTNNNQLDVGVSKLPPGFYRLHVKVMDKKSKKEHDFKSKYHDFVRFVIDESMEVPLPDSKKDAATLAGTDVDQNGIPDRVQRWINETFANKPNTKLAMKQYATAYQSMLLNSNDVPSTVIEMTKFSESFSCLAWVNDAKVDSLHDTLKEKMINTELRIRKVRGEIGAFYHGQGRPKSIMNLAPIERDQLCDFSAQKEE